MREAGMLPSLAGWDRTGERMEEEAMESANSLGDIAAVVALLLALLVPSLLTTAASRLPSSSSSALLVVILLASCFAGATGLGNLYRHITSILASEEASVENPPMVILDNAQLLSRSILSTITTVIFIVRTLALVKAEEETVNTSGILFLLVISAAKFVSVTILTP